MKNYRVEIIRTSEQYLQEMEDLKREQEERRKLQTCPLCGETENIKDYYCSGWFPELVEARFECLNGNCGCKWNVREVEEEIENSKLDVSADLEPSTREMIKFKNGSVIESIKSKFIARSRIKQ